MYMLGECFLMTVWRSLGLLCSAVRCLYIWLFILYSVHWLRSVLPILRYDTIEEINVDSKAEYTA